MRKSVKVFIIIASSLVGMGILFLSLSIAMGGTELIFKAKSNGDYNVLSATFDEVEALEISDVSNDVRIVKSENNEVKVTYAMSENFGYYLKQIDGTLYIEYDDFREWYEFIGIFSLRSQELVVELPEKTLEKLSVKTTSGSIKATEILSEETTLKSTSGNIETGGNVGELTASVVSGNIKITADTVAKDVNISTTSGNISFYGITANDTKLGVTSGDIYLNNASLNSVETDTMSGDVEFKDVICSGNMDIKTTSGEIELVLVDADNYDLVSTSGDIEAKILNVKLYNVKSTSGRIDVPDNITLDVGSLNAKTTSGDIEVKIVNQ